ncbi:MAG: hypothetical protein Greene071421_257 [Parcubacteria group bacterium Greene0714_21]|nr:MAG: hypothetical protein Greene041639_278 [Parcubacteria group bacterium Greene0416_39]TSC97545.1 MAG: hypothetical protein Greene101447_470 [Parcubacteria group bacterium Greene1014_47]TSD04421.1 MAG: hypothetical protein Greene071421_257 [Parcubacteria group bacterium Greene0714_21]
MTSRGPENLLRAIFRDKPADTPICTTITKENGETLSLQAALNNALDTLPFTKGKNDHRRWARRKTVLDKSYGLNGIRFTPREIGTQMPISPRYVTRTRIEALRELRRSEKVIQRLSTFFVPTGTPP